MFNDNPFSGSEGGSRKTNEVVSQERMVAMRDLAPKYGFTVTVLNKPGEKYTTDDGKIFDLAHDEYLVQYSFEGDLSSFWKEVNEVTPVKKDALSMLTDEFIANLRNGTAEKADLVHLQAILDERIANDEEKDKKYVVGGDSN